MSRITKPMMDRNGADGSNDLAYQYRRTIGFRVRDMRLQAEMTQRELGDKLGMGETAVSALELGRSSVSPERYEQLAKLFNLDRTEWGQWLLRYTDPYLYALIYGAEDKELQNDLASLNAASRVRRVRGPRH